MGIHNTAAGDGTTIFGRWLVVVLLLQTTTTTRRGFCFSCCKQRRQWNAESQKERKSFMVLLRGRDILSSHLFLSSFSHDVSILPFKQARRPSDVQRLPPAHRFTYCRCVVSKVLQHWESNREKQVQRLSSTTSCWISE